MLEKQRVKSDLIETFKILTDQERVKKEDFFQLRQSEYNFRGYQFSLKVQRSRINIRAHFFSQRIVRHWNVLPIMLYLQLLSTVSRIAWGCMKSRAF